MQPTQFDLIVLSHPVPEIQKKKILLFVVCYHRSRVNQPYYVFRNDNDPGISSTRVCHTNSSMTQAWHLHVAFSPVHDSCELPPRVWRVNEVTTWICSKVWAKWHIYWRMHAASVFHKEVLLKKRKKLKKKVGRKQKYISLIWTTHVLKYLGSY